MSGVIYPIHFDQNFERRWLSRIQAMRLSAPRRSRREGTDVCLCGHTVIAPTGSSYSPIAVTNNWTCSHCGRSWKTEADLSANSSGEDPS
jgi:hypothetical protein